MFKKFKPFCHAKSIYDIDLDFFTKLGVKHIFMDLDNTLDSYKSWEPNERSQKLIKDLLDRGIKPLIISNNRGPRVSAYANKLGVEYIHSTGKPFPFKINAYIKKHNLNKDEIIAIGDQMITDCHAANAAKIRVILTDKIVKEDQPTTHINRFFERPIRNYYMKKHAFKEWSEITL